MARTIVVVGASLAGGRAVETLREEGFDGNIVLIGAEPDRPYERPPLSKEVLRREAEPSSAYLRDEAWYADNAVDLRLGVRATAIDLDGKAVEIDSGERITYDTCLVATGGRARTLDVPGSDLEGVRYLRTMRDSIELGAELAAHPRVVVIGAGFIGAEVAASARTVGCDVTIIEVLDVPLGRVLGEDLGRVYAQIHSDHGVDLRLGEGVERFEGSGRVEAVVGTSGARYPADLVVVGVGIVPNLELAADAGLECGNGVLVDEHCRTSSPDVFAAGDVANRPDRFSGGRIRVEHFQNAQNQGPAAARAMLGSSEPFEEVPWFWSDQYELTLQMLGHPSPKAEQVVRGSIEERKFSVFYLQDGYVTAAVSVNRGKDISAARRMIQRHVAVDPVRLADVDVALKELLSV